MAALPLNAQVAKLSVCVEQMPQQQQAQTVWQDHLDAVIAAMETNEHNSMNSAKITVQDSTQTVCNIFGTCQMGRQGRGRCCKILHSN